MTEVALITGVSGGIGCATAIAFAKQGASLVLGGRNVEAGERLVTELGANALFRKTDASVRSEVQALVDAALQRFGRLDIAVNNAAIEAKGRIEDFDEAAYDATFDINVKGMFFAMQSKILAMHKTGGGSIVSRMAAGHAFSIASRWDPEPPR